MDTTTLLSEDDPRWRSPAVARSLDLGGTRVTYIPDGSVALRPRYWLPQASADDMHTWAALLDQDGNLAAGIGALLVDDHTLIDAGLGPVTLPAHPDNPVFAQMRGGDLPANLTRLGHHPRNIRAVLLTHLHLDHLGWLAHPIPGTDTPPFVNARYYIHETEWQRRHLAIETSGLTPALLDRLEPRVTTFTDDQALFGGIRSVSLPGHTDGHSGFLITGTEHRLWVTGDALHTPIQITHPAWSPLADHQPRQAATTRAHLIDALADTPDLLYANHFADVVFGTITRAATGRTRWQPHIHDFQPPQAPPTSHPDRGRSL